MPRGTPLSPAKIDEILARYSAGHSASAVSEAMGIRLGTVKGHVRRAGIGRSRSHAAQSLWQRRRQTADAAEQGTRQETAGLFSRALLRRAASTERIGLEKCVPEKCDPVFRWIFAHPDYWPDPETIETVRYKGRTFARTKRSAAS